MTNLQTLMMDTILPNLLYFPPAATQVQRLLELDSFVKNQKQFTAKIHCEATMMALIHFFTSTPSPMPVTPYSKVPDLSFLFQ